MVADGEGMNEDCCYLAEKAIRFRQKANDLQIELDELRAKYDALLTAAHDYWQTSTTFDSPEGRRADDALTALLGAAVEV